MFCLVSALSALYLQWNFGFEGIDIQQPGAGQNVMQEESFLPEVQFIKELVRSIFNIVKTTL